MIHTKVPQEKDFLKAEVVGYPADDFFIGVSYAAGFDHFGEGAVGIPLGYQFEGGDGLTRNFLRVEPFYNVHTNDIGVGLIFEMKF